MAEAILVTGASGTIGRRLCSALAAEGREVVALDREVQTTATGETPYCSEECDTRDSAQLEAVFGRHAVAAVVHLASLLKTASATRPHDATEVNVGGSLNVLETARKHGVSRVVYGSSISVYGSVPDPPRPGVTETDPAAPEDLYGTSKRYVEVLGEGYQRQFGIDFVSLRIAVVVGPGTGSPSSPWRGSLFESLGSTRPAGLSIPYGEVEPLPLVHVEDVVSALQSLVDADRLEFSVYNAPSETWTPGELGTQVQSLDDMIRVSCGEARASGIPARVSGRRLAGELGFIPVPLRDRLQGAAQAGQLAADSEGLRGER